LAWDFPERLPKAVKDAALKIALKRKSNPEPAAQSMYESFHGEPSRGIVEFEEQEHYHGHLAELGVMVGLKVRTVAGEDVTLGFAEADEDAEITSQLPVVQNTGTVFENGLRRSSRANKGKPPVVYQDENFLELMLEGEDLDEVRAALEDEDDDEGDGKEKIAGVPFTSAIETAVVTPFNDRGDIGYYKNEAFDASKYLVATPENFFVYFPGEAHRPHLKVDPAVAERMKKVVIKVKTVN
jgi:hypothetical protein